MINQSYVSDPKETKDPFHTPAHTSIYIEENNQENIYRQFVKQGEVLKKQSRYKKIHNKKKVEVLMLAQTDLHELLQGDLSVNALIIDELENFINRIENHQPLRNAYSKWRKRISPFSSCKKILSSIVSGALLLVFGIVLSFSYQNDDNFDEKKFQKKLSIGVLSISLLCFLQAIFFCGCFALNRQLRQREMDVEYEAYSQHELLRRHSVVKGKLINIDLCTSDRYINKVTDTLRPDLRLFIKDVICLLKNILYTSVDLHPPQALSPSAYAVMPRPGLLERSHSIPLLSGVPIFFENDSQQSSNEREPILPLISLEQPSTSNYGACL